MTGAFAFHNPGFMGRAAYHPLSLGWLGASGLSAGTTYFAGTGQERTGAQFLEYVSTFCNTIDAAGLLSKLLVWWPMIGGTSATHKINLLSPGTYDQTYVGTVSHAATGQAGDGASGYADTGIILSALGGAAGIGQNSLSGHAYMRNDAGADTYQFGTIGSGATSSSRFYLLGRRLATAATLAAVNIGTSAIDVSVIGSLRLRSISRLASTDYQYYGDGSLLSTQSKTSVTLSDKKILIHALNNNGTPQAFSSHELAGVGFGAGLTGVEIAALAAAVHALNTSLGRAV